MKLHIISADWYGGDLHILGRDGLGGLRDVPWGGAIDWQVSPGRRCVGRMGRDGHRPCPTAAPVSADRQCSHCAPAWSACVFEPQDHGEEHCFLCQREHVVYLAFYGNLPKVGMTSGNRIDTRVREQGADGCFVIQRRPNRAAARRTEQLVAMLHGVPEYRRHHEILPQLTRPVDRARISERAEQWRARLAERFDVEAYLDIEHPMAQVLPATPHRVAPEGRHAGCALGAKGRYLFYEGLAPLGKAVHALKLGELVGRTVVLA